MVKNDGKRHCHIITLSIMLRFPSFKSHSHTATATATATQPLPHSHCHCHTLNTKTNQTRSIMLQISPFKSHSHCHLATATAILPRSHCHPRSVSHSTATPRSGRPWPNTVISHRRAHMPGATPCCFRTCRAAGAWYLVPGVRRIFFCWVIRVRRIFLIRGGRGVN
jgi:hypothetical protein